MSLQRQAEAKVNEGGLEGREPDNSRDTRDPMIANIRAKVRRFMLQELQENGFGESVGDEESLIGREILDSLSILKLISFVDEEFGIFFSEEELDPEKFETVNRVAELIRQKLVERNRWEG